MMAPASQRIVLFLCTGNYYRSRFAECLFNSVATRMGLSWRAASRALALERGVGNVGPMAPSALEALQALGIHSEACTRLPARVVAADFEAAARIVALKETEHRPLLQERFPTWTDRVEYWQIDDAPAVLPLIEREVMDLIARLLGGARSAQAPATPPAPPREKPVVKVGRETKGRRGKGVTTVFDLPLDDHGITELAARLEQRCGTGGTVKDGRIEIQGDQRDRLVAELEAAGFKVKRVGG
jgi:predicted translation initiation factor SUI1